jgi:hypothetical protein
LLEPRTVEGSDICVCDDYVGRGWQIGDEISDNMFPELETDVDALLAEN